MLGMSRNKLAKAATIAPRTVSDFERGARQPHPSTLRLLQTALEAAGIIFIEEDPTAGPGVRLRKG